MTPLGENLGTVVAEVKRKEDEGSSSSQLCNPECIIHHGGETCKEDSLVVVKDQKECVYVKSGSVWIDTGTDWSNIRSKDAFGGTR